MKKLILTLTTCLFSHAVYAGSNLPELKAGYFFFMDEELRDVYGTGAADFQLSYTYFFNKHLGLYGSAEYIQQDGTSKPCRDKAEFYSVPLSLGLKFSTAVSRHVDVYATLGPRYFFVHVKNYSFLVDRKKHESGLGGFANFGFLWHISDRLALDAFGEYSYKRLQFHGSEEGVKGRSVQVGGAVLGAGIGYLF